MKQEQTRTWRHMRGELNGVTVTATHVCYWRHSGDQVWERVELHDWLAGAWPQRVGFYVGEAAVADVTATVQGLVNGATYAWDKYN